MSVLVNKHASQLARQRWAKLSPEERSAAVPRNGGPTHSYPPCIRKHHRFKDDTCRFCGLVRQPGPNANAHRNVAESFSMTAEQAKEVFRGLVARYGRRWDGNVPQAAFELLEEVARLLTDEEKRELCTAMRMRS